MRQVRLREKFVVVNRQRDHAEQFMGITILKNSHPTLRRLKQEHASPTCHGHKIWHSGLILMDYFTQNPLPEGCRVLDVGCGWGMTGIFLAKRFSCDVVAVDIDKNVFPFLHLHADVNGVDIEVMKKSYAALDESFLKTFDVVVGGDICFWDALTNKLDHLCRKARKARTRVVISDPGRQPFYDLAERCEKRFGVTYTTREIVLQKTHRGCVLDIVS